jgi:microsomal prostaglandin-E synthase 2
VEVNPLGKKEIKWSEYKKVPVLVVDGEQLNDSTEIISTLQRRIYGDSMDATSSDLESDEEQKWRRFNFASFDPTAA